MSEKRKAPGGAATPTEAMSEKPGGTFPVFDFTITPVCRQSCVADFLTVGEENAVTLQSLKSVMHLDGRSVRQMIQQERLQGVPILSSNTAKTGGYYIAATQAEVHRFTRSMRKRAQEILRTAEAVEKTSLARQISFEEWGLT